MPESFPLAIKPGWSCWTGCVPHPSRFVPPSLASQDFWSRAWAGRAETTWGVTLREIEGDRFVVLPTGSLTDPPWTVGERPAVKLSRSEGTL